MKKIQMQRIWIFSVCRKSIKLRHVIASPERAWQSVPLKISCFLYRFLFIETFG